YDVILEGNNKITKDLKLNYQLGAIYTDNVSDNVSNVASGLLVANKFSINFGTKPTVSSGGSEVEKQSVFGQMNLGYKDAIFLNGSVRNDWDSRLPSPHSYAYYSAGISGVLSELFTFPDFMSFLKVGVDYAEVGNGGQFGLLNVTYGYQNGVGPGYLARSSTFPIPGLKPEIVQNTEASIEAGFLKNRLNFTFTYYRSNAINQLLTIGIPAATGFSSQYINAGNIQNQGVEVVLSAKPVVNGNFNWNIDFNLGINKNKVVSLSDNLDIVYLRGYYDFGGREQIAVGGSFNDISGYGWARNATGQLLVDANGKPITDMAAGNDPKVFGDFNPAATLGLSNSFAYKRFSLRMLVDGRVGGIIVDGTEMNLSFSGLTKPTLEHRDGGWDLGGVDKDGHPVSSTISASDFWQTVSSKRNGNGEFYVYDATNFRVRELSLGYSIPLQPNFFIKSANFSLVARNLFWLYRGKSKLDIPGLKKRKLEFDPDMTVNGVVYGQFPSTRSIGFNLSLTF
ncbi:MAG: outer membrane beta-barrel protein, partial [Ginsengibacter sp.]